MHSPLVRFPAKTLLVPSRYCGSIDYYAAVAAYGSSCIDTESRFNKRDKAAHRTTIADVNGPLLLTVPIAKPEHISDAKWTDIYVSSHGSWSDVHRVALESAYGRTPFFEFYADRILPLIQFDNQKIIELNSALDKVIRDILGLPEPVEHDESSNIVKYQEETLPVVEYYQVRSGNLGFIPHLSVLDLIFNMGPESPLILKKMINFASLT
ncbi:MAG: WbqC family protein [Lachnoclostridium sp.]|nr:WbqC family protein [Lachnoclostridium sp.]